MLTEEDVDSWNKLFPDCQINKTSLTQPTEHFLTKALVCYLRRFGYKVEPPFSLNVENKENTKETRIFLMKLVRQIDHFLKITDKSYAFSYYDLIKPTVKKTSHMLSILLNYYYYYNLYKEKVFEMADERIRKWEDLKTLIDETRRDNEQRKEEALNIKSTIDNLMEELPKVRIEFKEMQKNISAQKDDCEKLNHSYQELKEKLKHLEEQKKHLRKHIVPDEESRELENQLKILKSELAEHKQMNQKNEATLEEGKDRIRKLQHVSKEIEEAREIIPLCAIEQLQESIKQLEKVKKEKHEVEARQNLILQEIEEETRALESLEHQRQCKIQEYEPEHNEQLKKLETKQNLLNEKNCQLEKLEHDDHVLDYQLEEQEDIAQYLEENITEIMAPYKDY